MRHDPFPFQVLDDAFRLLGAGPSPLAVDGSVIGGRLPRRDIAVTELRSLLLHPSIDHATRNDTMRHLLGRARAEGGAWTVALAGMLLPGLRSTVAPLVAARPDMTGDVEAEALTGLVEAIASQSVGERVAASLVWAAGRRAYRLLAAEIVTELPHAESVGGSEPRRPWGHPDFVLAEAVRAGKLTSAEADLIGETRLGDMPITAYAERLGIAYRTAILRRWRAEQRLIAWITSGKFAGRCNQPPSNRDVGVRHSPEGGPPGAARALRTHPREGGEPAHTPDGSASRSSDATRSV